MPSAVYFDHAATTPPLPEVLDRFHELSVQAFGNSAAPHRAGLAALEILEDFQLVLSQHFQVPPQNIIFTSGGTESNNQAILSSLGGIEKAFCNHSKIGQLLTSVTEHSSVEAVFRSLEAAGSEVNRIKVNEDGLLDLHHLSILLQKKTRLLSLHHVQNVTGTCQDISTVGEILKSLHPDAFFHVDAVQSWLKVPIDIKESKIDILTLSAHKNYGPKGLGITVLGERFSDHLENFSPLLLGAPQQHGMRPGTVPVPLIGSFLPAFLKLTSDFERNRKHYFNLRDTLISGLPREVQVIGPKDISHASSERAPHILTIAIPGIHSTDAIRELSKYGFCVSAGSACNAHNSKPNEILLQMGLTEEVALSSVRISFGIQNTTQQVIDFNQALQTLINYHLFLSMPLNQDSISVEVQS